MTKRNAVYLAGSMEDVSPEVMNGWRQEATEMLENAGIEVLDPTRREHEDMDKSTFNMMNRIVAQDLQDISYSRVVLVDLRDSTPGRKWGTVMEIALAQRDNRVIIAIVDEGQKKHPFIYTMVTEVHNSVEDAVDATISYWS